MIAFEDRKRLTARAREIGGDALSEDGAAALAGEEGIATMRRAAAQAYSELSIGDSEGEAIEVVLEDFVGYGPLTPLLSDDSISEIIVNPGGRDERGNWREESVWVERGGLLLPRNDIRVGYPDDLAPIIRRIAEQCGGRRCDDTSPTLDAYLPDGSRVNAVAPRNSPGGWSLNIRKHAKGGMDPVKLVELGACSPQMMLFLRSCVAARCNAIISGGTGSGKTTMLNAVASFIPTSEHIVVIEDTRELQLRPELAAMPGGNNVVYLQSTPPNSEGLGVKTIHDLLVNALRMRPERIIVGEVRGAEAYEMLQAMQTGHDGSLTTLHANNPASAFMRLESMILDSRPNVSEESLRRQIGMAVDLIVHTHRSGTDGSRRITSITAVEGYSDGKIVRNELFSWDVRAKRYKASGFQSNSVMNRILDHDLAYDKSWFREGFQ